MQGTLLEAVEGALRREAKRDIISFWTYSECNNPKIRIERVIVEDPLRLTFDATELHEVSCPRVILFCEKEGAVVVELLYLPHVDCDVQFLCDVEIVVRLRVRSELRHPLVHPDTWIFQQETARDLFHSTCLQNSQCGAGEEAFQLFIESVLCRGGTLDGFVQIALEFEIESSNETLDELLEQPSEDSRRKRSRDTCDDDESTKLIRIRERRCELIVELESFFRQSSFSTTLFQSCLSLCCGGCWIADACILDPRVTPFVRGDVSLHTELGRQLFFDTCVREECAGVFSFALFLPSFCERLANEVVRFEDCPIPHERPNSMNQYGVVLSNMGLKNLATALCERLLYLVSQLECVHRQWQFSEEEDPQIRGAFRNALSQLDTHHTFVVHYGSSHDSQLDMHSDDSEVTFNVNVRNTSSGSALTFCGLPGTKSHRRESKRLDKHDVGRAVFHLGALRHGAGRITSGERMNLIFWLRSSWLRQNLGGPPLRFFHPQEDPADAICMSRAHDPDFNEPTVDQQQISAVRNLEIPGHNIS